MTRTAIAGNKATLTDSLARVAGSVLLLAVMPVSFAATDFDACIAQLTERARAGGISEATIDATLAIATLRERVIDADRRQPEFTDSFARYLGLRVTPEQVRLGRQLAGEHAALLGRITRSYGVPGQYLLALWAVETSFGRHFGNVPTIDALATLACDARRSDYFAGELMDALRIIDRGDIRPQDMIGSWAGAMGHVQFMPSVYLRHAVDGDGDGRIDLWHSVPDALTSAAGFLHGIGWRSGERWGREVRLPADFDYMLAGRANARSLAAWQRLGVRDARGGPLPVADMQATLLVPAGHRGPKFLVYANFDVLMRWNRSEFFALTVGHLADRIAGAEGLNQPPPADMPRLHRDQVLALQRQLNEKGFDSGTPDGILGPATRAAIRAFQQSRGWLADGHPDARLLDAFDIATKSP